MLILITTGSEVGITNIRENGMCTSDPEQQTPPADPSGRPHSKHKDLNQYMSAEAIEVHPLRSNCLSRATIDLNRDMRQFNSIS
jgi:hypothetical protein